MGVSAISCRSSKGYGIAEEERVSSSLPLELLWLRPCVRSAKRQCRARLRCPHGPQASCVSSEVSALKCVRLRAWPIWLSQKFRRG